MKNTIFLIFLFIGSLNAQDSKFYLGAILDNDLVNIDAGIDLQSKHGIGLDVGIVTTNRQVPIVIQEIHEDLGYRIRPYLHYTINNTPVQLQIGTINLKDINIRAIFYEKESGKFSFKVGSAWSSKTKASIFCRVFYNLRK